MSARRLRILIEQLPEDSAFARLEVGFSPALIMAGEAVRWLFELVRGQSEHPDRIERLRMPWDGKNAGEPRAVSMTEVAQMISQDN